MSPSKAELAEWISAWIVRELKLDPAQLDRDATFVRYGMDSVRAMMLVGDLEDHLTRRLSPTLAWDHPTLNALAGHLAESIGTSAVGAPEPDSREVLAKIDQMTDAEVDALLRKELEKL
jgi:acyl carrier protein